MTPSFCVVVATIGRPCLQRCVDALGAAQGPLPRQLVLVDDGGAGLAVRLPASLLDRTVFVTAARRGPATARNVGWRAAQSDWVVFVDDDVMVDPDWYDQLLADLSGPRAAGVQGRLRVPLPTDRAPTDWERNVAGLADARWATADMAYRRTVLDEVGGFDERFPRAYREDADLALRVLDAGYPLRRGARGSSHPVRPAPWWISLRTQAGNADDALMARLHGRRWRERAAVPAGRRRRHVAITIAGIAGAFAVVTHRRRLAVLALALWSGGTAELAIARLAPGPRTGREAAAMVATSVAMPPLATAHWLRGVARAAMIGRHA